MAADCDIVLLRARVFPGRQEVQAMYTDISRLMEEMRGIQEQLTTSVQPIASLGNPVDLTGSAVDEDFSAVARILSESSEIDCVVMLLLPYLPGITSDLGARLSNVYLQEQKPIIAYVPHVDKFGMMIEGFELNRIPVSQSIEGAVHMAVAMRRCQPC